MFLSDSWRARALPAGAEKFQVFSYYIRLLSELAVKSKSTGCTIISTWIRYLTLIPSMSADRVITIWSSFSLMFSSPAFEMTDLPDVIVGGGGVTVLARDVVQRVLELVVVEIWRNHDSRQCKSRSQRSRFRLILLLFP